MKVESADRSEIQPQKSRELGKIAAFVGSAITVIAAVGCRGNQEQSSDFRKPTVIPTVSTVEIGTTRDVTLEEWQESLRTEGGYEIREVKNSKPGEKVDFSEFKGQKLMILFFAEAGANRANLEVIKQARGDVDFRPIFVYSQNEIPDRDKDVLGELLGEDDQLYLLFDVSSEISGFQREQGVRPGTASPVYFFVSSTGIVEIGETTSFKPVDSEDLVKKVKNLN